MKMRKEIFATIFLSLIIHPAVGQIPQLIMLVANLETWALTVWEYFDTGATLSGVVNFAHENMMKFGGGVLFKEISQSIPDLSLQLEAIRRDSDGRMKQLAELIVITGIETRMSIKITELENNMGVIDELFDKFKAMMPRGNESLNLEDLCVFATNQLSNFPIRSKVASTLNVVFPRRRLQEALLDQIVQHFNLQGESLCGRGHSPHQYLHAVYLGLLTIAIKAYVIQAYSHSLLSKYNGTHEKCVYANKDAATSVMKAHGILVRDLRQLNKGFGEKMRDLPRTFRACDRDTDFERDETFLELEGAIQGILACIDAYPGYVQWRKCDSIDSSTWDSLYWNEWKFRATHPVRGCSGQTSNCIDAGFDVNACLETNGSRRYKWVDQTHAFTKSGDPSTGCEAKNHIDGNRGQCKFCLCDCNDNDVESSATHIFNLQTVESDIADNKVITGIRFIVQYRILQLQIQQGELGVNWEVTDVDWKPVNDISDDVRRVRLGRPAPRGSDVVEENKDFLILKKPKNNAINLDTLEVPHKHVLTGVKFSLSKEEASPKRIAISLIATKFDHITGKLCTDCQKSIIESNEKHDHELTYDKINAYKPTFPTSPKTTSGQYIRIDSSDQKKDAGQATLPYFDAIPVESSPPSPLGGVGLVYKTKDDFAGFLSLQLISVDYTKYMEDSERDLDRKVGVTADDEESLNDENS